MNQVKIKIDGYEIECNEGESILNTARANGVFIPAICYLTSCSPTLACKMCMVEVDGKRVYACNAKVKDGLEVIVNTPEIEQERKAIMQAYDVNHPCSVVFVIKAENVNYKIIRIMLVSILKNMP